MWLTFFSFFLLYLDRLIVNSFSKWCLNFIYTISFLEKGNAIDAFVSLPVMQFEDQFPLWIKTKKIKLDAYNISTHRCGSMSTVTKFSGINNFMFTMGFKPLVFSQICKQMDKIFAVGTFILNLSDYSPWNLVTVDITPESSGLEYRTSSFYIIFWYSTWCWHMFWMQVEEPRNAVVQKKNVCAIFWKKTMWIKKWLNQMEKSGRVGCIFCRFYQLQDHQLYKLSL